MNPSSKSRSTASTEEEVDEGWREFRQGHLQGLVSSLLPVSMKEDSLATKKLTEGIFKFGLSIRNDNFRSTLAHKDGGLMCPDPKQIEKLRSVGTEMIKQIGRKILSGKLNLTTISFPIRACAPRTALVNSVLGSSNFPYFVNEAGRTTDILERFKLVLVALVSASHYLDMFLKPLNPILGQTLQASLPDGTQMYAEQISHHPPISYFYVVGPQRKPEGGKDSSEHSNELGHSNKASNFSEHAPPSQLQNERQINNTNTMKRQSIKSIPLYSFSGFYDFAVSPSLNSLTLANRGLRSFHFYAPEHHEITATYSTNLFSNTFIGTTRIEEQGSVLLEDKAHNLRCEVKYGQIKGPTDIFETLITQNGEVKARVRGTYCGYVDIDGKRYWDCRDNPWLMPSYSTDPLPSDWTHRPDVRELFKTNPDMNAAQKIKENLQQFQRRDRALREAQKQK